MQLNHLFYIIATSALAAAAPTPPDKIVGGEEASKGQFPYIVSVQLSGRHVCGGSLANKNTVITAAHCADYPASQYQIRAGTLTWATEGITSNVSEVIVAAYNTSSLDNDIAVLKLTDSISESEEISYVSLPESGSDPEAGVNSTVAGWGTTAANPSTVSAALLFVDVPIVSRKICQSEYFTFHNVTDTMICAGEEEGGQDSCYGDSGGPLMVAGKLEGIVSWGRGCARKDYAGVYTRVGTQIEWLQQHL